MGQTPSKRRPASAPALAAPYGYFYGPGFGQGYVPHHGGPGPVLPANYMPPAGFMPHYGQMQVQMPMPMAMPQPYVWPVAPSTRKERSRKQKTSRKRRERDTHRAVCPGRAPCASLQTFCPDRRRLIGSLKLQLDRIRLHHVRQVPLLPRNP